MHCRIVNHNRIDVNQKQAEHVRARNDEDSVFTQTGPIIWASVHQNRDAYHRLSAQESRSMVVYTPAGFFLLLCKILLWLHICLQ
jgi:hypothetical protein